MDVIEDRSGVVTCVVSAEPNNAPKDGPNVELSAREVVALLTTHARSRTVVIRGAALVSDGPDTDVVDLRRIKTHSAIVFDNCTCESLVDFTEAEIGRLELAACRFSCGISLRLCSINGELRIAQETRLGTQGGASVSAPQLQARNVIVNGSSILEGAVDIHGGVVDGGILIDDGASVGGGDVALDAYDLRVFGNVDVRGKSTSLRGSLNLTASEVERDIYVGGGARIIPSGGRGALEADSIKVGHNILLSGKGTRLDGSIDLEHATIQGALALHHVRITSNNEVRVAVNASALAGRHGVIISGAQIDGALHLDSASIGALRLFSGAVVMPDIDGHSIYANAMRTTRDISVRGRGTRLHGAIVLYNASIGDQIAVGCGAVVDPDPEGCALRADGIDIVGNLFIEDERSCVYGRLRLVGARIGGQFAVRNGVSIRADPSGNAVDGDHLTVGSSVVIQGRDTIVDGALDLTNGSMAALHIDGACHIFVSPGNVALAGRNLSVEGNLTASSSGTRIYGGIDLVGARLGGTLALVGGVVVSADGDGSAVMANQTEIKGSVNISGMHTRLDGALELVGASIHGQLSIDGGAVVAGRHDGLALVGDSAAISAGLFVEGAGTHLDGALRLVNARIAGIEIRDRAVVVANSEGEAMIAYGADIRREVNIADGGELRGTLDLMGASVGGLVIIDAKISGNDHAAAVTADGAEVKQLVVIARDAIIDGAVTMTAGSFGHIGVVGGGDVRALDLSSATIASLKLDGTGSIQGELNLKNATVRLLRDTPAGWQRTGSWQLAGVQVESVEDLRHDASSWNLRERIGWLSADRSRSRRPFAVFARLYREAGHPDDATRILMAGEAKLSARSQRMVKWPVGYGYRPGRAVTIALVLIALTSIGTSFVNPSGLFVADEPNGDCPRDYPCLDRVAYVIETIIPIVDLGQRRAWRVDAASPFGQILLWLERLLILVGWFLGIMAAAAVSGIVQQE